ncbi:MAG: EAL domain-containing protein [Betaproteobacteria bacterium]|nr:MAG: EAL domain-containing protein [Betaproteobacteria bacterium]
MIWHSVTAMTIIDVIIIAMSVVSLIIIHKYRATLLRLGLMPSVGLISIAIGLIALFYFGDLVIMHVVPLFTSPGFAMALMEEAHLNWSWVVFLGAVFVIASGLIHLVRKVAPRVERAERELRESHDALEARVRDRTRALREEITERRESERALRDSEVRYRSVVEDVPAMICRFLPDGTLTFVNEQYCRHLNRSRQRLMGQDFFKLVPEETRQGVRDALAGLTQQNPVTTYEHSFAAEGGTQRWQRWTNRALFDAQGRPTEYQLLGEDITESKRQAEILRDSEERFRNLIGGSVQGIFIHRDYEPLFVNQAFAEILGYDSVDDLITSVNSLEEHLAPHERDRMRGYAEARMKGEEAPVPYEYDALRKDGKVVTLQNAVRVINWEGEPAIQSTVIDVTEARSLSEQLSYQASHDPLTGLLNRRAFEHRLQQLLEKARTNGTEHVLCYLDLDQFKVINDSCGHTAGDELLRQLGVVLQQLVRGRDTLARLGGDEFAILLERCSIAQAERVTSAVRNAIEKFRFAWEDKIFSVGISVGVVPIDHTSESIASVLGMADAACYAAKDAGRNRVHIYREDDADLARRRGETHWVAVINRAFEDDRFLLHSQSITPLGKSNGARAGHELLVRMRDDDDRVVVPGSFLPAAERYNLTPKLDRWVVGSAFDWFSSHREYLGSTLMCSINLSGSSLGEDGFLEFVVQQLRKHDLPPEKICFEITETAAIANLTYATRFINVLKSLGCRFALDDFGSGLSSFAYLKNLQVDYLKIDGMFVKDMIDDPIHQAMVKSINDMGHVMGKETIAEFAESDAVLEMLKDIGFDYAQGYGLDQPRPLEEMTAS